jgi:hypothetical protein
LVARTSRSLFCSPRTLETLTGRTTSIRKPESSLILETTNRLVRSFMIRSFGNLILRDMFERRHHGTQDWCAQVAPVLLFANTGSWRDVEFLGLAVPGAADLTSNDDLVAGWKLRQGKRFQNYQAKFTILNAGVIPRQWINDISARNPLSANCRPSWRRWVEKGVYDALKAPRVLEHRTKSEQLPGTTGDARLLK